MKRKYSESDKDDDDSESVTSGSEYKLTDEISDQSSNSYSSCSNFEVLSDKEVKNKKTKKLTKKRNELIKKPRVIKNQPNHSALDSNYSASISDDSSKCSSSSKDSASEKPIKKVEAIKKVKTVQLSVSNNSTANSSIEVTMNLNSVGSVLKNKHNEILPTSSSGTKKNCCYYCLKKREKTKNKKIKVLYAKLVDHYESQHSQEDLIIELLKLKKVKIIKDQPKSEMQIAREEILNKLRNKANYLNNLQAENVTEYVVARRPKKGLKNPVANYGTCFKCSKQLSLTSLNKHVRKCTGKSFKNSRIVKSSSRATMGEYHESATEGAIAVISCMRENEVTEAIKYDHAIFAWLNAEASKFETVPHRFKKTRADLSRLGRLKLEMINLNNDILQLSDIFVEEEYDNFIKACKKLGKFKEDNGGKSLEAPATASDLYHLIQNVANIYSIELGSKKKVERENIKAFIEKLKVKWHSSIGNTIAESQAAFKRRKIVKLPEKQDMERLHEYLDKEMSTSFKSLQKIYKEENYLKLRNAVQSYIHMTNVKRAGEIERITLEDLDHVQIINNNCRLEVRGKRTKPVPIVFTKLIYSYLKCLKENRTNANIHKENPYVFANINNRNTNFTFSSACTRMREFSELCGAKDPETLRGTLYRKNFATDGMIKGIDNQSVEEYSSFMGHTPRIHNQNYRQGVFERDIRVSKLVLQSQTSKTNRSALSEKNDKSMESDDESESEASSISDTENCDNSNTINAERNKIVKEKKKLQWTQTSIDALLAAFPHVLEVNHPVPSVQAVNAFIRNTKDKILSQRTDPQIRSWIHMQRKQSNKNDDCLPKRDNVPSYIYSKFDNYIKSQKIPSIKTCAKFLAKSPSKANLSINDIQTWVKMAIRRKST